MKYKIHKINSIKTILTLIMCVFISSCEGLEIKNDYKISDSKQSYYEATSQFDEFASEELTNDNLKNSSTSSSVVWFWSIVGLLFLICLWYVSHITNRDEKRVDGSELTLAAVIALILSGGL